jgi:putative ABC transport system permease protein
VLEDFPRNTNFAAEIFAPASSEFSNLSPDVRRRPNAGLQRITHVLVRLKKGSRSSHVQRAMPTFLALRLSQASRKKIALELVPLPDVHLHASELPAFKLPDDKTAVYGLAVAGGFILLIAGINFINLATAQTIRRAAEVAVRKAVGASHRNLFAQFVSEAALQVCFAAIIAVATVELVLPALNALLQRELAFSLWRDAEFVAALGAAAFLMAILAGAYPAAVLSHFRPLLVLRGILPVFRSGLARQSLVFV